MGIGLLFIGTLDFSIIEGNYKIDALEYEMKEDIFFSLYKEIEYIEMDIDNIKVEYEICEYCNINTNSYNNTSINFWVEWSNPIKIINEVIDKLNNKKILSINDSIKSIKIYISKENIEKLQNNEKKYNDIIAYYENRINELENENFDLINQIEIYKYNDIQ